MDDRKIDEILNSYTELFAGNEEKDLKKLREKQKSKQPKRTFSFSFKKTASAILSVAVIAIVMIIAIPKLLPSQKDKGYNSEMQSPAGDAAPGDSGENIFSDIVLSEDALDHVQEENVSFGALSPNSTILSDKTEYTLQEGGKTIGVYRELYIFNHGIDTVFMHAVNKDTTLNYLSKYKNLTDTLRWQNVQIKYSLTAEKDFYTANLMFSDGSYNYYIEINGYGIESDIKTILDTLFGKEVENE